MASVFNLDARHDASANGQSCKRCPALAVEPSSIAFIIHHSPVDLVR
jgi:hypothetical protein